jgi:hypothetical protein
MLLLPSRLALFFFPSLHFGQLCVACDESVAHRRTGRGLREERRKDEGLGIIRYKGVKVSAVSLLPAREIDEDRQVER